MKITIEKQEWQLLGQLALEISQGQFPQKTALHSLIIWEYYLDNLPQFTQPQTRKRKLRNSTAVAIYQYLQRQPTRDDILWDTTLYQLKDKIYQKILSIKTEEAPEFKTIAALN